jgi:hypothetical protein
VIPSRTPEYGAWSRMKDRCANKNFPQFRDYGGRGIRVCESWSCSFARFLEDMGPRPTPRHSLDRINNDGNYEPGNCRWATPAQQLANRRITQLIEIDGLKRTFSEWTAITGFSENLIRNRWKRGVRGKALLRSPQRGVPLCS